MPGLHELAILWSGESQDTIKDVPGLFGICGVTKSSLSKFHYSSAVLGKLLHAFHCLEELSIEISQDGLTNWRRHPTFHAPDIDRALKSQTMTLTTLRLSHSAAAEWQVL